jgi:hypothetical protein
MSWFIAVSLHVSFHSANAYPFPFAIVREEFVVLYKFFGERVSAQFPLSLPPQPALSVAEQRSECGRCLQLGVERVPFQVKMLLRSQFDCGVGFNSRRSR